MFRVWNKSKCKENKSNGFRKGRTNCIIAESKEDLQEIINELQATSIEFEINVENKGPEQVKEYKYLGVG